MTAYYNEHDKFAAAWLRELMHDGLIAPGFVDERSILDVAPSELAGYRQCHFFAGIGIWSLALRQAGWADDRPIWTGSCPCQPFSAAGKGGGFDDERHLWPAFHWLVDECGPAIVVGEQVSSDDGLAWVDLVLADLDQSGYACGALDTCAAGFGAPHIRQRLYWMGYAVVAGLEGLAGNGDDRDQSGRIGPQSRRPIAAPSAEGRLAHAERSERRSHVEHHEQARGRQQASGGLGSSCNAGRLADGDGAGRIARSEGCAPVGHGATAWTDCGADGMADAGSERRQQDAGSALADETEDGRARRIEQRSASNHVATSHGTDRRPGPTNGRWALTDWLGCRDGKWRPVESGTFPLAPSGTVRNRVGTLRGAGNALNLAQAQAFIEIVSSTP